MSFFSGFMQNELESEKKTNYVNCEGVLERYVCSALQFIPHEPRKILILFTMLQTKTLSKSSRKIMNLKFPQ